MWRFPGQECFGRYQRRQDVCLFNYSNGHRGGNRNRYHAVCAVFVFIVLALGWGCDVFTQEVSPEKLPPVPEKCLPLSEEHKKVLAAAYSSVKASQMQVAKAANEFGQCMQDEGLSKAEAKGILKKNEAEARQAVEKGGGSDMDLAR